MENNSFLKKFQGRTEIIGRGGLMDIMNNVHINVKDFQPKPKKQSNTIGKNRKKSPKDEYNHITSEISKEFNKNKNYVPQLRSLSNSIKLNNNENNKINNKNIARIDINNKKNNNILKNNQNQYEISNNGKNKKTGKNNNKEQEQKSKVQDYKNNQKDKPIKLFKYLDQNQNIINNQKQKRQSKDKENNKKKEYDTKNIRYNNNKSQNNILNNNSINNSKSINNNKKMKIQLPIIIPQSISSKSKSNNNLPNIPNVNKKQNYKRMNTFTPIIKKNINNKNYESEKNNKKLKEIIRKKIMNNRKERNYFQNNSVSLPKINVNKSININNSPYINIKEYNYQKNSNMKNEYNNIINNIRKDFLLLDSIKNRNNNNKNNNLTDRHSNDKKINYQINNMSVNTKSNNIKLIDNNLVKNFNKNHKKINNYINHSYNKINSINNNNNYYNLYNQNNLKGNNNNDLNLFNDLNNNTNNDNINNRYNINSNNINNNENINDGQSIGYKEKKAHTSFDNPKRLPKLKNKLDIINEEEEDDNKYITDIQIGNIYGNEGNLNTLEILMKQRMFYQNKIPNNSRFKLKQVNQ